MKSEYRCTGHKENMNVRSIYMEYIPNPFVSATYNYTHIINQLSGWWKRKRFIEFGCVCIWVNPLMI